MSTFAERMIGAATLDVHTYEEVEADTTATTQAMVVVVLSSIAQGIGFLTQGGVLGFVTGAMGALIGWFIWAFLVYIIGTKVLPEPQTRSDLGDSSPRNHEQNHDEDEPADQAYPDSSSRALIVQCLPHRDDHGNQHPDTHYKSDQPAEERDDSEHPQQTRGGSETSGA